MQACREMKKRLERDQMHIGHSSAKYTNDLKALPLVDVLAHLK